MPIIDLVLDTNVLVHASNDREDRQIDSVQLITYLLASTELICVDTGFDTNETVNKSYVGYEYLKHLKNGMLGYAFVVQMALNKRICEVTRQTKVNTTRAINQCMSNNHDKVFIKVAVNSNDKILITHDFTDFALSKRTHLKKTLGIDILVASDIPDEKKGSR
jgi:hypothetical protein